jgi:hypothetical protein
MAGTLTISTLKNDTGVLSVQNGMTGIPKAWVNFAASATPTINSSFNVSSITYTSTGLFTVNFTTAMPNATYAFTANAAPASGTAVVSGLSLTTSSIGISSYISSSGASTNFANTCVAIFSS